MNQNAAALPYGMNHANNSSSTILGNNLIQLKTLLFSYSSFQIKLGVRYLIVEPFAYNQGLGL